MTNAVTATARKVRDYFHDNKEKLKTRALVTTTILLGGTVMLMNAQAKTRDQYLDTKDLKQDFKDWLLTDEDREADEL